MALFTRCGVFVVFAVITFGNLSPYVAGSSKSDRIAAKADSHVGSRDWSYASSRWPGRNTNKGNIFVADVIMQAGIIPPQRHWWKWSPISSEQWAFVGKMYKCWTASYPPRIGDVAADGGHVGIVTGDRTTTSASSIEQKVVKNDWGFRSNSGTVIFWRYTC